jgi:hypothetical protein
MKWVASVWMEQTLGEWMEDHYPLLNVYGVVVTNERGKRWMYTGPLSHDTKDRAEKTAELINFYIEFNPDWEPKDKYWTRWYPVYGSKEYQETGEEQVWAARERQIDADGPDKRLAYIG